MKRVKYIDFGRNHGTGRMDLKKAEEEGLLCTFEPKNREIPSPDGCFVLAGTTASGNPTKAMQARFMALRTLHGVRSTSVDHGFAFRCEL
jgi:hypothetical protein